MLMLWIWIWILLMVIFQESGLYSCDQLDIECPTLFSETADDLPRYEYYILQIFQCFIKNNYSDKYECALKIV